MKCAMCNRPLTIAAETVGIYAYGPKCAKRAGLGRHKERRASLKPFRRVVRVDLRQADWVQQAQQGAKSAAGAVFGDGVGHG